MWPLPTCCLKSCSGVPKGQQHCCHFLPASSSWLPACFSDKGKHLPSMGTTLWTADSFKVKAERRILALLPPSRDALPPGTARSWENGSHGITNLPTPTPHKSDFSLQSCRPNKMKLEQHKNMASMQLELYRLLPSKKEDRCHEVIWD